MTIQRQYSLPNCTLVLEGISDPTANGGMIHPMLSVVTGFQCYFAGQEKPLSGGRDLLNQLVITVSDYAQTYLSGVPHRSKLANYAAGGTGQRSGQSVQLAQVGSTHHRLLVQPQEVHVDSAVATSSFECDLTTVQLFDLVEAIDQLLADGQTLPDLKLNLSPLPKRHAAVQKPTTQQTVPALLGITGLAAAAFALFFVPIPEVRRPEPVPDATSQTQPGASPAASPAPGSSPTPTTSPAASSPTESPEATTSPTASPSPDADSSTESSATSPSPGATNDSANAATNPAAEAILSNRPEITDPAELERLQVALYDQLDRDWRTVPTFSEELVYRVGVDSSGEVLGFKFANDPALNYVNETPLIDLRYNSSAANSQEPIAQFKVVFQPDGVLEVSPWHGQSESEQSGSGQSGSEPSPTASPLPSP